MNNLTTSKHRQRGAALAVSLILLLVMTIVGIAAMNGARLEIDMAGLMQDEQDALRRGERTLTEAVAMIEEMVAAEGKFEFYNEEDEEDGMYAPDQGDAIKDIADTLDWSGVSAIQSEDHSATKDHSNAMVIQYLGPQTIPGGDLGMDGEDPIAGEIAHVYRITTRSETKANSVRIIESIYTTFEGP